MSGMGLTPRQNDCLAAIKTHVASAGVPPTYDELGRYIGLASKSGIVRLVNGLVERGYLRRIRYRARAIEIVEKCCPHCGLSPSAPANTGAVQ